MPGRPPRPGMLAFTQNPDTPHTQRRSPQGNCRLPAKTLNFRSAAWYHLQQARQNASGEPHLHLIAVTVAPAVKRPEAALAAVGEPQWAAGPGAANPSRSLL